MRNRERQIFICKILIILNLCFIWGNSLLPGEASAAFSDWVKNLLAWMLPADGMELSGGGLLRKLAHFTEFATLGFLLSMLFRLKQRKTWYALPLGVMTACMDETIQMFVPDRGPGILDVGIDTCGVLTGMFLLYAAHVLMRKQTKSFGG